MEEFRRGWWGWIRSSDGYSIRLIGRTRLQYRDALGELDIFAEPMSQPWSDIVVDTSSIPDTPDRTRGGSRWQAPTRLQVRWMDSD